MTRPLYGHAADVSLLADRITPAVPCVPQASPPIQLNRWFRNSKHPNAEAQQRIAEHANSAALYRSKEVFTSPPFAAAGNGSFYINKALWNFAFHTGPYTQQVYARFVMNSPYGGPYNSYGTLSIYSDAALTTLVTSQNFVYGNAAGSNFSPYVWQTFRAIDATLLVSPDTDYYAVISGSNNAFIQAVCVWEAASLTQSSYGGYLAQNYTTHTPIVDVDRQNAMTICRNVWKRGGSKVFNWAITPGSAYNSDSTDGYSSITTSSITPINIFDLASTAISAATPGFTIDGRYKNRISQPNGTPCVIKALGYTSGGITDLQVIVKNSAGTTIATVSGFTTTNSWKSTTFNLPPVLDKYDVFFCCPAGGATKAHLYAISCWEQE